MTEHYVTLFDSVFLPQGLALHHSLLEHGGDFLLWVLCLDQECLSILRRLDLPQMRLLDLGQLETPELLQVKPGRSHAEYCWTLTSWSVQWVFEAEPSAGRVTYVDADLFFLKDPSEVFASFEASSCKVLITDHSFAPEYDQTPTSGRFCVQFLSFCRGGGEPVLGWWRDQCLEWCFARIEDGRFGDQKYLEQFSSKFPGLIYEHGPSPLFQAPWNATVYPFSRAIAFHFHGLRFIDDRHCFLSNRIIPKPCLDYVYKPYIACIRGAMETNRLQHPCQMVANRRRWFAMRVSAFIRRYLGLMSAPPGIVDIKMFLEVKSGHL